MEETGLVRMRIRFTGRVQGVGFRYTARYAAMSLGLTGWVENRSDGSVLMEVQGSPLRIDKLLRKLNSDSYIRIDGISRNVIPPDPEERAFKVHTDW